MTTPRDDDRPYVVITGDTHGGAPIDAYRAYLDPSWRDEFDTWRAAYKNPSKKHLGTKESKGVAAIHAPRLPGGPVPSGTGHPRSARERLGTGSAGSRYCRGPVPLEKLRSRAEGVGITPALVATPLDEIPESTCPTFLMARYEGARRSARPA